MPGNKRKAIKFDLKQVVAYRQKLRQPADTPLKLTNRERKKFTFKSPYPQEYSIPSSIIYYITQNPTFPDGHQKMISSCKSLFRMSAILPVKRLENFHCVPISFGLEDFTADEDLCYMWYADNQRSFNFKKHVFKLWICGCLRINYTTLSNIASTLTGFAYKFSLQSFKLEKQILTFEELKILVSGSNLEDVEYNQNVVKNDDGSITDFEKVFELLCCTDLTIVFPDKHHGVGKNTANKIAELLSSEQTPAEHEIYLSRIPQTFDFSLFPQFLNANMTGRQHTIDLRFVDGISDAYKNQLQKCVNDIIQLRGIFAHTVPDISFPGQNKKAYWELWKMRRGYVEGILQKPGIF